MFKKISILIALLFMTPQYSLLSAEKTGNGFYGYEDIKNPSQQSPDVLISILLELKKQTKIQEEILSLMKQNAGVPQIIEVNGKKCLENSSVDCFKMPITGDAMRIPVMKAWLENPTIENAMAYYQWQVKYLKHSFDAGYSLNFAGIQTSYPFQGNSPVMQGGANDSSDQNEIQLNKIINKNAKFLKLSIILGKTGFDFDSTVKLFDIYENMKKLGVKVRFIFPNKEALELFANFHKKAINKVYVDNWNSIPKEDKVISPSLYKSEKIYITPLFILNYNNQDGKDINQVVGSGRENIDTIRKRIKNFFIFFKIETSEKFNDQQDGKYSIQKNIAEIKAEGLLNENSDRGRQAREFEKILQDMQENFEEK